MTLCLLLWVLGTGVILSEGDDPPFDDEDFTDFFTYGEINSTLIINDIEVPLFQLSDYQSVDNDFGSGEIPEKDRTHSSAPRNHGLKTAGAENADLSSLGLSYVLLALCMLV